MKFNPTHRLIVGNNQELEVMLTDGVAYTEAEWEGESTAEIEVVDGEWIFQGKPFDCVVRKVAPGTMNLIRSVEHWRESGDVGSIVEQAEKQSGYCSDSYSEYDDFIEEFRASVESVLVEMGADPIWVHQQSVGVGAILQGPFFSEEERNLKQGFLDRAIDQCSDDLLNSCIAYGKADRCES